MTIRLYTDDELEAFRTMPKKVTNPRARWSEKPSKMPYIHNVRSRQSVLIMINSGSRFIKDRIYLMHSTTLVG